MKIIALFMDIVMVMLSEFFQFYHAIILLQHTFARVLLLIHDQTVLNLVFYFLYFSELNFFLRDMLFQESDT